MSGRVGGLGQRILRELSRAPGGRLRWQDLKRRFPIEVAQRSFYRSVRSLRRTGRIVDYEEDHGPGRGVCRYIVLSPVYEAGGRLRFAHEADRELVGLVVEAHRQLAMVAAARGVRLRPRSRPPRSGGQEEEPGRTNNPEGADVDVNGGPRF